MTTDKKITKPSDEQSNVAFRLPIDVEAAVTEFLETASPATLARIEGASLLEGGKPHKNPLVGFAAYAIRMTLAKGESAPRAFGSKIDEFVDGIVASNAAAFEANPENWWELTAIGASMLRDAGHNPNSVKRWLDENGVRIAAHHAAVGIADPTNHNRKAGKARKAMAQ